MIRVEALSFTRNGNAVLDGVSLSVDRGETVAMMGPNGAGKTSLLKLVAGLRAPAAGRVEVDGVAGFAPEDPQTGLFAETVAGEVEFFPGNRGLDVDPRREAALAALDIEPLRGRDPYSLSVGEQRRVSIAAVVSGDPDVLLLDEPTRGLDAAGERALAELVDDLDATVLLATHAADFAYELADRVAVLVAGRLQRLDAARTVLRDVPSLEAAGIRPPGIVSWARKHGIDPPPSDLAEAVARVEPTP